METVGRKLSHRIFLKSLRLLTTPRSPKLVHTKVIQNNSSVLRNVVRPNQWSFNLKTCNFSSSCVRLLQVSCIRSEDSEDPAKQQNYHDKLEDDAELQKILKDIILDFNDSSPTNDPPKASKQQDQTEEATVNSKPCETCGSINKSMPHSIEGQFKVFDESQTEEIFDYYDEEEQQKGNFYLYQEKEDPLGQYDLRRGKESVFDIEELVDVLHQENATDLVVISVPDHLHYCKYLVLVTARSPRHLKAIAEFINKLYKKKKDESDAFIIPEGKGSKDWKILDMGQIVLHLFLESTRKHYDLETLWTVGEEFDDLSNTKQDPVLDLLQQHIQYLDEIEPLSASEKQ